MGGEPGIKSTLANSGDCGRPDFTMPSIQELLIDYYTYPCRHSNVFLGSTWNTENIGRPGYPCEAIIDESIYEMTAVPNCSLSYPCSGCPRGQAVPVVWFPCPVSW